MLIGRLNHLSATIVGLILGVLFVFATAGPASAQVQPVSAGTGGVLEFTYDAPIATAEVLAADIAPVVEPSVATKATAPGPSGQQGHLYDFDRSPVAPNTPRTAIRPVGRHLESVDDVLASPELLAGRSPVEVQAVIGRTPGWQVERLGRGSRQGQGWVLWEYTSAGDPTGRMLRWHPGGGHNGPDSYWRVTDYNTRSGIIR